MTSMHHSEVMSFPVPPGNSSTLGPNLLIDDFFVALETCFAKVDCIYLLMLNGDVDVDRVFLLMLNEVVEPFY